MNLLKLRNLVILTTFVALNIQAYCAPLSAQTLLYDHVHLAVPDPDKAADWYVKYMGATKVEGSKNVAFGPTLFSFLTAADPLPSAGSVIDHIGFSFSDLDAKMAEWQAAGIKIVSPTRDVPGMFKVAYIEDPWGGRIEVVQDPETLGFHHIHLRATDPEVMFQWLQDSFGGERTKFKGRLDALKYGSVWVFVQKADQEPTPSIGHIFDHIGWRVDNLDTAAAKLKRRGVKFTTEPTAAAVAKYSYVVGPYGLRVEVLQRY